MSEASAVTASSSRDSLIQSLTLHLSLQAEAWSASSSSSATSPSSSACGKSASDAFRQDLLQVATQTASIQEFQSICRSILLSPSNHVCEILRYTNSSHHHMLHAHCLTHMRWIYMKKQYETEFLPSLNTDEKQQLDTFASNPIFLPTRKLLLDTFHQTLPDPGAEETSASYQPAHVQSLQQKYLDGYQQKRRKLEQLKNDATKNDSLNAEYSFEDLLYLATSQISSYTPLCYFGHEQGWYDALTVEYVTALATYLQSRCDALDVVRERGGFILEIGAGNGRLSYFLTKSGLMKVPIIVTDIYVDRSRPNPCPVKQMDSVTACDRYKPVIILCSYMSTNIDLSEHWRKSSHVKEYVLLGDSLVVGRPWETSGIDLTADHQHQNETPLYQIDGFTRYDISAVSRYAIHLNDTQQIYAWSKCFSFRRETNATATTTVISNLPNSPIKAETSLTPSVSPSAARSASAETAVASPTAAKASSAAAASSSSSAASTTSGGAGAPSVSSLTSHLYPLHIRLDDSDDSDRICMETRLSPGPYAELIITSPVSFVCLEFLPGYLRVEGSPNLALVARLDDTIEWLVTTNKRLTANSKITPELEDGIRRHLNQLLGLSASNPLHFQLICYRLLCPHGMIRDLLYSHVTRLFYPIIHLMYHAVLYHHDRTLQPSVRKELSDPLFLPTREKLQQAFHLSPEQMTTTEPAVTDYQVMEKVEEEYSQKTAARREFFIQAIQQYEEQLTKHMTLKDAILVLSGDVYRYSCLQLFATEQAWHEFLTQEYIHALATYLQSRCQALGVVREQGGFILEIGAGNGRLSYFLSKSGILKVPIIVTDIYVDRSRPSPYPVKQMDSVTACDRYKPVIILCSYMSAQHDLSEHWRKSSHVKEYVLIGAPTHVPSTATWETYGLDPTHSHTGEEPPYELDGFTRTDLPDISKYAINMFDSNTHHWTRCMAFRRTHQPKNPATTTVTNKSSPTSSNHAEANHVGKKAITSSSTTTDATPSPTPSPSPPGKNPALNKSSSTPVTSSAAAVATPSPASATDNKTEKKKKAVTSSSSTSTATTNSAASSTSSSPIPPATTATTSAAPPVLPFKRGKQKEIDRLFQRASQTMTSPIPAPDQLVSHLTALMQLVPVQEFEQICLKLLCPSGMANDLVRYVQHPQLIVSMRYAYQKKLFLSNPYIRKDELERISQVTYLCTRDELLQALHIDLPKPQEWKFGSEQYIKQNQTHKQDLLQSIINRNGALNQITLKDALSLACPAICGYSPLYVWGHDQNQWDVLTQEFIQSLATYIQDRIKTWNLPARPPLQHNQSAETIPPGCIVEIGAGNGRLAYFLNQSGLLSLPVIPTDVMIERTRGSSTYPCTMYQYESEQAVKKFKPSIIICSWMHPGIDLTAAWRVHGVLEYILLGEALTGTCGRPWETYGVNLSQQHLLQMGAATGTTISSSNVPAPYQKDGYTKHFIDDVARYQINVGDFYEYCGNSRCVAFRRSATAGTTNTTTTTVVATTAAAAAAAVTKDSTSSLDRAAVALLTNPPPGSTSESIAISTKAGEAPVFMTTTLTTTDAKTGKVQRSTTFTGNIAGNLSAILNHRAINAVLQEQEIVNMQQHQQQRLTAPVAPAQAGNKKHQQQLQQQHGIPMVNVVSSSASASSSSRAGPAVAVIAAIAPTTSAAASTTQTKDKEKTAKASASSVAKSDPSTKSKKTTKPKQRPPDACSSISGAHTFTDSPVPRPYIRTSIFEDPDDYDPNDLSRRIPPIQYAHGVPLLPYSPGHEYIMRELPRHYAMIGPERMYANHELYSAYAAVHGPLPVPWPLPQVLPTPEMEQEFQRQQLQRQEEDAKFGQELKKWYQEQKMLVKLARKKERAERRKEQALRTSGSTSAADTTAASTSSSKKKSKKSASSDSDHSSSDKKKSSTNVTTSVSSTPAATVSASSSSIAASSSGLPPPHAAKAKAKSKTTAAVKSTSAADQPTQGIVASLQPVKIPTGDSPSPAHSPSPSASPSHSRSSPSPAAAAVAAATTGTSTSSSSSSAQTFNSPIGQILGMSRPPRHHHHHPTPATAAAASSTSPIVPRTTGDPSLVILSAPGGTSAEAIAHAVNAAGFGRKMTTSTTTANVGHTHAHGPSHHHHHHVHSSSGHHAHGHGAGGGVSMHGHHAHMQHAMSGHSHGHAHVHSPHSRHSSGGSGDHGSDIKIEEIGSEEDDEGGDQVAELKKKDNKKGKKKGKKR